MTVRPEQNLYLLIVSMESMMRPGTKCGLVIVLYEQYYINNSIIVHIYKSDLTLTSVNVL